jgi:hypothetical protein
MSQKDYKIETDPTPPPAPLKIVVQGTVTSVQVPGPQDDPIAEAMLILRIGRSEVSVPVKVFDAVKLQQLLRGAPGKVKITLNAEVDDA